MPRPGRGATAGRLTKRRNWHDPPTRSLYPRSSRELSGRSLRRHQSCNRTDSLNDPVTCSIPGRPTPPSFAPPACNPPPPCYTSRMTEWRPRAKSIKARREPLRATRRATSKRQRSSLNEEASSNAASTSSSRGSCFPDLHGESRSLVNPDSGSRLANLGARGVTPLARTRASFRRYRADAAGRFFAPDRRSSLSTGRSSPQFVPKRTAR